jgi:hypothetical protein
MFKNDLILSNESPKGPGSFKIRKAQPKSKTYVSQDTNTPDI